MKVKKKENGSGYLDTENTRLKHETPIKRKQEIDNDGDSERKKK